MEILQNAESGPGLPRRSAAQRCSLHSGVFAQVRDNGRILDVFKIVLGGTDCLKAQFSLSKIFSDPVLASYTISLQRWPRDLDLRKGLLSRPWRDIAMLVSARDASVLDSEGAGIPASEFLKLIEQAEEGPASAAASWAVVLGSSETTRGSASSYRDSQQLQLQLGG